MEIRGQTSGQRTASKVKEKPDSNLEGRKILPCNQLTDWPHERMKEALQKLYSFCSDYPNIRHAGNPGGVLRPLAARDATGLSVLLLAFSGYLSPHLDEQIVLGV